MTVQTGYENGVFRPTEPVDLPNHSDVEFDPRLVGQESPEQLARHEQARRSIFQILSRRDVTGQTDAAARHNEHQP